MHAARNWDDLSPGKALWIAVDIVSSIVGGCRPGLGRPTAGRMARLGGLKGIVRRMARYALQLM